MRRVGVILTLAACGWAVAVGGATAGADETPGGEALADEEVVDGYLLLDATGIVHAVGEARSFAPGDRVRDAGDVAVSLSARPDGEGDTVAFGGGSTGAGGAAHVPDLLGRLRPGERVAATRLTPDLFGSWTATVAGRVIVEGTATHHGDLEGVPLQGGVIDLVPSASGNGYWLVAGDGGVFAFGDASFHGSMGGQPLNAPVVDLVPDPDGVGYWLIASDGGVFAFEAPFVGSLPGVLGDRPLNAPVVAGIDAPGGYVLVGADGGVFDFAEGAPFLGSLADQPLAGPIVDLAATSAVDRWVIDGTFIDEGDGPLLCWSTMDSFPPQCGGGPRVVDLDWEELETSESAAGTTWGEGRVLVTTVDDATPRHEAIRVIGPAEPPAFVRREAPVREPMCEAPPGGWAHDDPARVTEDRFRQASVAARELPGHADAGVGRIVPLGDFPDDPAGQEAWLELAGDPFNDIVTIRTAGDAQQVVAAVREHWGGPLCVLPARFTEIEERAAQSSLPHGPNVLGSASRWGDGIEVVLAVADGALVESLDRELGPGMLSAVIAFQPVP